MIFSFIVPVYNVEKYLARCLESLLNQSFTDFEIIVVNDGSPDNSQRIIDDYAARYPDKIKAFIKENGGLSDARNYGIERASGEYLLFVDSDDYIDLKALENLIPAVENGHPDVIGFGVTVVTETGESTARISKPTMSLYSGEEAIISLVAAKIGFEAAWGFAYRSAYWKDNNFNYMKGIYHEDFALTPLVLLRAESVTCIDFAAYYYVSTPGSIIRTQTPARIRKRAEDLLTGYDFLLDEFFKKPSRNIWAGKMYLAYAANSVIDRFRELGGDTKLWFRKEVVRRNVAENLLNNTLKRKLRKAALKLKHRI